MKREDLLYEGKFLKEIAFIDCGAFVGNRIIIVS